MKSIILCIPYFGKLPNYFQQFLNTCAYNTSIDFILFTDDVTKYDYPKNYKVVYTGFYELRERIQSLYDFTIALEQPYKICDFRPAFGEIFAEEFMGYDYWGHCDMDLLFGDIRKFVTDDLLEKYDKIGHHGHLTLFKNTPEINLLYRAFDEETNTYPYKEIFQREEGMTFDEWSWPWFDEKRVTINDLFMKDKSKYVYYDLPIADLVPYRDRFIELTYNPFEKTFYKYKNVFYYFWSEGTLIAKDFNDNPLGERIYVHLIKRKISISFIKNSNTNMIIIPDVITIGDHFLTFRNKVVLKIKNCIDIANLKLNIRRFFGKIIKTIRRRNYDEKEF